MLRFFNNHLVDFLSVTRSHLLNKLFLLMQILKFLFASLFPQRFPHYLSSRRIHLSVKFVIDIHSVMTVQPIHRILRTQGVKITVRLIRIQYFLIPCWRFYWRTQWTLLKLIQTHNISGYPVRMLLFILLPTLNFLRSRSLPLQKRLFFVRFKSKIPIDLPTPVVRILKHEHTRIIISHNKKFYSNANDITKHADITFKRIWWFLWW